MTMAESTEARATAILEAMNQAIRTARFDSLESQVAMLETVLADLQTVEREAAARLRQLAKRNTDCLEAAAQGLRAGRRRLVEIAAAERADTYDHTGTRRPLSPHMNGRRL